MILRSMLFIPGDSEKKLSKADTSTADAIILDLEDSVAPPRKPVAREMVPQFLAARAPGTRSSQLWVRINPLEGPDALADLAAVVPGAPDGIMLPKANGPEDLLKLSHYLDALEAAAAVAPGSIRILPVATETARAPFHLGDYSGINLPRLQGLTWGAEDLSSAVGASTNLDASGQWAFTYKMVRSMTLLAAHAAEVQAIDTLYVDFRDPEGLTESCRAARAEGFSGRIAIHPNQVDIINESFMPSEQEVALAQRIVAAFDADPNLGTIGIDGKMYDIPHLNQARNTLALHAHYAAT
jgi:citrate lyase subunit beta / citryl-CoA lyase